MNPSRIPVTPTWAEVSLKALKANYQALQKLAKGSEVLPVVKANAYGHGAAPVSKALLSAGARMLAVATVGEGVALRREGLGCPILVLTPTLSPEIQTLLKYRLTPQVSSLAGAQQLSKAAKRFGARLVDVHVKIDTGMGRLGVRMDRALREVEAIRSVPQINLQAVYTHLATADWSDPKFAWTQIARFQRTLSGLQKNSPKPLATHLANSAALITYYPQSKGTWVRPGIALYGVYPNPRMRHQVKLTPVLQVKTRVLFVKDMVKGDSVSYGRTYKARKKIRVATLAMGYADGVLRSLSNKGSFLIRGKKVPIVGTVCMDMTMVDVSLVQGVKVGDEAVFFGGSGKAFLSVEEQAARAGTISYELLCAVGERVQRVYV